MKYIDKSGQGNTLLILTDAESRLIRHVLSGQATIGAQFVSAKEAFNRGIARGTDKMTEESKAEWKARKK